MIEEKLRLPKKDLEHYCRVSYLEAKKIESLLESEELAKKNWFI